MKPGTTAMPYTRKMARAIPTRSVRSASQGPAAHIENHIQALAPINAMTNLPDTGR